MKHIGKGISLVAFAAAFASMALSAPALAQTVKVGVSLSTTGPAAALGVPIANVFELLPREIGGVKLDIIVLDDGGDAGKATTNARRLITDDKVDVIVGSSTTPPSSAIGNVAFETQTLHLSTAPVAIPPDRMKFTFQLPQDVALMADVIFKHMQNRGVKTLGMIGFSDSWGDLWLNQYKRIAEPMGIKLVAEERYGRADTSVTGQALKIVAARPDAVLVAASGTGAALPNIALRERGYTGQIYQTHGAVSNVLMRIGGKSVEGTILSSGPAAVADLLPAGAATKAEGEAYIKLYEAKHGPDSRTQFGGHGYDAFAILKRIIPAALKTGAKPGTQEFKIALLNAITTEKDIVASQGIYNFTEKDHFGLDERGRVLLVVKDGRFALTE